MDETPRGMTLGERLAWVGLLLVTMLCITRAMAEHDPFPWWQSDPFRFAPPITGLTPRWALLLNAGIVFFAIVHQLGQWLRGVRLPLVSAVLAFIGLGVLTYHSMVDLERVIDASTIMAVVAALITASQAHTLPGAKRLLGCVTLGFALLLTVVGAYEVFVTHAETLRAYEQSRESFLAARGWTPGSFEAMSYERRLNNPEPIAWFGLTNVFASFMAATGAGLLTLTATTWRSRRNLSTIIALAGVVCLFGLLLTGSKGGFGALLIGLLLGGALVFRKPKWLNGRIVVGLCLIVLIGLALRGVIGEQLGERSLLFRWQYIVGSARIWMHGPLVGCGPGVFQDQYALLKPALSPEDVASPHNVVFAWIATLGLGGLAITGLLVRLVLKSAPEAEGDETQIDTDRDLHTRFALLLIALPTLMALNLQSSVLTGIELLPVLLGAVLWGMLSVVLLRSSIRTQDLCRGCFVMAAVLMIHAIIEVTGSLIVSAPLWALCVGMCVVAQREEEPETTPKQGRAGSVLLIVSLAGVVVLMLSRWGGINAWERELHSAARDAVRISDIHAQLDMLEFSTDPAYELNQAAQMMSELAGARIEPTYDSVLPALNQIELNARLRSIEGLKAALDARPSHTPTRVALSQQMLWVASVMQAVGDDAKARSQWDQATGLFEGVELDAGGHRWAGNIWEGRVSSFPQAPEQLDWLRTARAHMESAMELAPHDPHGAIQLMEIAIDLEEPDEARKWAREALHLHSESRLDPLRGLSDAEFARATSIANP